MKKRNTVQTLGMLVLLLVLAGFLTACPDPFVPTIREIRLDHNTLTLKEHGTEKSLQVIVVPSSANKSVTWSSDDDTVATVDDNGQVTPHEVGTAVIKAKDTASGRYAECAVTVISIDLKETLDLELGKPETDKDNLVLTINVPSKIPVMVVWSSSDTAVATVTGLGETGRVQAVGAGEAVITATVQVPSGNLSLRCKVTVTGISLNKDKLFLKAGKTETLSVKKNLPGSVTDQTVKWESSDTIEAIIKVKDGEVTAVAEGSATITAEVKKNTASNDDFYTATCTVIVTPAAGFDVIFDKNGGDKEADPVVKTVIEPATTVGLLPATNPTRNGYTFVEWNKQAKGTGEKFKADTLVTKDITVYARWAENYTVTFNKNGGDTDAVPQTKTVIYPDYKIDVLPRDPIRANYTFDGWNTQADGKGKLFDKDTKVDKDITVYAKWGGISLNKTTLSLAVGAKETLSVLSSSVLPTSIAWDSSALSVATVNTNGEVTAVAVGDAVITATVQPGDLKATCAVTVTAANTPVITLDQPSLNLTVGGTTGSLTASITNSTDTVSWASSNPAVATVNPASGSNTTTVTALKAGTATITASLNGAAPAECTVDVTNGAGAAISSFSAAFTDISSGGFTIVSTTVPAAPPNGQAIEYAFGTTNTAPSDENKWKSLPFSGILSEGTTYHVFARAKENDSYYAGAPVTSTTTLNIPAGTLALFAALGTNCTYNGNTIMMTSGTVSLTSNVTIPSGVNLVIKGTLTINDPAVFTLNGTMTIDGGTFEIPDPGATNTTFKVEDVLKGSGTELIVQNGGTLKFPTTGTITSMLSGISGGSIEIQKGGQVTLNRVMSDGENPPSFISGTFPFIGDTGFYEINEGKFEIGCNGNNPQITIPENSKVTVSTTVTASPALGGGKTVPLNNNLDVKGELIIAEGCELAFFTVSIDSSTAELTITDSGKIYLAGSGSKLRVSKKDGIDGQKPGIFTTGIDKVYQGTSGTTPANTVTDDDWTYYKNP